MKKIEKSIQLGDRKLTLTTGVLAQQATGSVLAKYGDTVVLSTVVSAPLANDLGYFPLTVEYQERLYAGGRIKGSRWVKREGRPSDGEILSARLIDRSIRPLFPKEYKKDVQVINMVLSVDMENDPAILSAIATSAALTISSIPWKGPVATLKIGMKDGKYFTNPTTTEMLYSDMDLIVTSSKESVLMIEAGAKEVSEEQISGAIEYAAKESKQVLDFINSLAKEAGQKKQEFTKPKNNEALVGKVKKHLGKNLDDLVLAIANNEGSSQQAEEIKEAVFEEFSDESQTILSEVIEKLIKEKVREMILSGKRPDGRKPDEIRKLSSEVSVLPRTHGSAIFLRGQTQVLTVATLGAPSLEQLIESAEGEESKRYMHHYSMPPYATGETGRIGSPSRREIGHGALAERALEPVIPPEGKFPYAIRVVSEVMSSNGSTSMASTCGSTLALMDAGVPITSPISGIAMGLVIESPKKYAILKDIIGLEDFMGDMDFKVTGSKNGITAMQLDVKTLNLTPAILKDALAKAKEGRMFILESMLKTIDKPREKVSSYAPKIKVVKVPTDKIGEVIGPGGKTIRKIMADTGTDVEVEDDGSINITATTDESLQKAIEIVESLTKEVKAGEIYKGVVKRIQPFGAFVEILPGKDGLVHVSDMSEEYVNDPNEVVSIGNKVEVRVKQIDDLGRINLSMILDPAKDKEKTERRSQGPRFRDRKDRNKFSNRNKYSDRQRSSSGPHFPTSRYMNQDNNKKDFSR